MELRVDRHRMAPSLENDLSAELKLEGEWHASLSLTREVSYYVSCFTKLFELNSVHSDAKK